jgi:DNA phosphorothioation-dependent restriction protein DptG
MTLEELKDSLNKSFCSKGSFQHRKAELIRLFPYVTHSPSSEAEEELLSYRGICGEVSRQIKGWEKCDELNIDLIKPVLESKVETKDFDHLLDIIKRLAFDERGAIAPFALSAIPYLNFSKDTSTLREIGNFLCNVYFTGSESLSAPAQFGHGADKNVLHSLIHACLPPLQESAKDISQSRYHKVDVGLTEVFEQDWLFLCDNPKLLHKYFPEFLKLYSLLYQLRTIEKLHQFFTGDPLDPIFFTLEWESCSTNRIAYQAGWKRLEPKIKSIFSHVNCLELLNHVSAEGLSVPFVYDDLKQWSSTANEATKREFGRELDYLISFYKEGSTPRGGWALYEPFGLNNWGCDILNKTEYLFRLVDCQFKNSHRNAPAGRYAAWLIQFAVSNFVKRRGRIGNTLAFNRNQIMFLARLAVGSRSKLRLHDFWGDLERRGIAFDNESRRKIVELFERLNLLEKKSDSGDAQYVRAII